MQPIDPSRISLHEAAFFLLIRPYSATKPPTLAVDNARAGNGDGEWGHPSFMAKGGERRHPSFMGNGGALLF